MRFLLLLLMATPAFAQTLEPGEWEFTAMTSSPLLPSAAQKQVFRHCVRKEDAENPERWMARQSETGDCKLTPGEKTADSMKWEMVCPRTGMRGNGIARLTGPGAVEGEMQMTGEVRGQRFQLHTRTSGRRLGPCKT